MNSSDSSKFGSDGSNPGLSRRTFLTRTLILSGISLAALCGVDACAANKPAAAASAPTVIPTSTAVPTGTGAAAARAPTDSTEPLPTATGVPPTAAAGLPVATAVPTAATTIHAPSSPRQPNVLLVTIDTLRADHLGSYGFAQAHTPNLDRIAKEGVRFDRAICQLPQTDPSHAALMTGLYSSTNGVKIHMVDILKSGTQTIATVFAAAGYQTAGIYSWVSLDPQFCGLNQGFQTYEGYVLNRGAVFSNPALEQLAATYRQLKAKVPIVKTADLALGASGDFEDTLDGRADVTTAAVLNWLDSRKQADPFFLWLHYYDPHYPYSPPQGYDHLFGLKYNGSIDGSVDTIHKLLGGQLKPNAADLARLEELYQGEIAFTDAQFGSLLSYLTSHNLLDDTILVVTGDHGESFGEHGDWTHGLKVYETEIRVPLLMRYPPRLTAGMQITPPVQLIDVMPTLLDLTGLRAAKTVQGTSLLPYLNGTAKDTSHAAFTELADESFVSVLNVDDWKLIRNDANDEVQLFHLDSDESEANNLAQAQPGLTAELHSQLLDLMKLSGVSH